MPSHTNPNVPGRVVARGAGPDRTPGWLVGSNFSPAGRPPPHPTPLQGYGLGVAGWAWADVRKKPQAPPLGLCGAPSGPRDGSQPLSLVLSLALERTARRALSGITGLRGGAPAHQKAV